MIIKHSLSASVFQAMKNRAKEYGASVNDVILAAFFRVVHDMANVKEGQTLGIPNMVNLRRYIPGGVSAGFTNLTAMVVSSLEGGDIGKDIFETLEKVKTNMDELKKYYPGLHGLALLKVAFRYFPHGISKFLISTFFKNPLIGVSNIGIVEGGKMVFGEAKVEDTYITGSVKYPPYMQLALSTFNNIITFSVAVYGTKKDKEMFEEMYRRLDAEILAFIR